MSFLSFRKGDLVIKTMKKLKKIVLARAGMLGRMIRIALDTPLLKNSMLREFLKSATTGHWTALDKLVKYCCILISKMQYGYALFNEKRDVQKKIQYSDYQNILLLCKKVLGLLS